MLPIGTTPSFYRPPVWNIVYPAKVPSTANKKMPFLHYLMPLHAGVPYRRLTWLFPAGLPVLGFINPNPPNQAADPHRCVGIQRLFLFLLWTAKSSIMI